MELQQIKIVIVGESCVGKTTFVYRFAHKRFKNSSFSTVGTDFTKVKYNVKGREVELRMWDTAGQERYRSLISRFYRGADGVIIMYDVQNECSFESISWWINEVKKHAGNIPMIIVGNKSEDGNAAFLEKEGRDFAEKNKLNFFLTSSKTGKNVDEVFHTLVADIYDFGALHKDKTFDEKAVSSQKISYCC